MSAEDLGPAYEAVLEAAEVLLGYSALVTGALAQEATIELTSIGALQRKLSSAPGGPGLGEWTAVLQEISGNRKRRGLRMDHPLHELGTFSAVMKPSRRVVASQTDGMPRPTGVDPTPSLFPPLWRKRSVTSHSWCSAPDSSLTYPSST